MEIFLKEYYPWLIEISTYSAIVPVAAGMILVTRRSSLLFRLLLLYCSFVLVVEFMAAITVYMGTKNNIWLDHLYTPIEFTILASIFFISYKGHIYKYGLVAIVVIFWFFSVIFGSDITQMNSIPRILQSVFLIAMAVLYFYQILQNFSYTYLDHDPVFLLSCGILIYHAGTSVAYAMFNEALAESYNTARICITIVLVLNILFRINLLLVLKRTPAK